MKLLIELYGIKSLDTFNDLVKEHPNMDDNWYIRNTIRILSYENN